MFTTSECRTDHMMYLEHLETLKEVQANGGGGVHTDQSKINLLCTAPL